MITARRIDSACALTALLVADSELWGSRDVTMRAFDQRLSLALRLALGSLVVLSFVSTALAEWYVVFDDAFISYRYARNLAAGYGLTWNAGEPPTEGYTNLLLVLVLAPLLRIGADPLLVVRALSLVSVVVMAALLHRLARRRFACSPLAATLAVALLLLPPATASLCMVGLETVVYTAALFATFLHALATLRCGGARAHVALALAVFVCSQLRPEVLILHPLAWLLALFGQHRRAIRSPAPLVAGAATMGLLLAAYLVWKHRYFGGLLPNPFYIKAAGWGLSSLGVASVTAFVATHAGIFALMTFALAACRTDLRPAEGSSAPGLDTAERWLGGLFVAGYLAFFLRTETLMDIGGRFLFPLLPIVIYLGLPALRGVVELLDRTGRPAAAALAVGGLVIATSAITPAHAARMLRPHTYLGAPQAWAEQRASSSLMQRELRLAHDLAAFPEIRSIRVAFGDAGVVPYSTDATWLDPVGLNDGFIARTRDRAQLLDYFFGWQPDLAIQPGLRRHRWLTNGHGPLGDFSTWASDRRWDDYDYVGTVLTEPDAYDLHLLVRRRSPHRDALVRHLSTAVVDGRYPCLPLPIGSVEPTVDCRTWMPRPGLAVGP